MHHGETEIPVDMVESLEHRLLLRAVLMPLDWKPIAGLISSGQQSGDKAIKLFEQHRFPVEGQAIPH